MVRGGGRWMLLGNFPGHGIFYRLQVRLCMIFFRCAKACAKVFFFNIKENRTWIAETTFPNGTSYMSSFQQFLLSRKPGLCTACDCNN